MSDRPVPLENALHLDELECRINSHMAQWEREQARTPAQKAAWVVIDDLLDDPLVWRTHGAPGDYKLDKIAERIARALEEYKCAHP